MCWLHWLLCAGDRVSSSCMKLINGCECCLARKLTHVPLPRPCPPLPRCPSRPSATPATAAWRTGWRCSVMSASARRRRRRCTCGSRRSGGRRPVVEQAAWWSWLASLLHLECACGQAGGPASVNSSNGCWSTHTLHFCLRPARSNLNEGITICDPSQKDCPVVYCNDAFLRCGRRAAMDC